MDFYIQEVKQGCPLSPLLFIVAIEPLVNRLASLGFVVFVFADDLTAREISPQDVVAILDECDLYGGVAGPRLGIKKCGLLPALPISDLSVLDPIYRSRWRALPVVEEMNYLGVLFGQELIGGDAFRDPYEKFLSKMAAYKHSL